MHVYNGNSISPTHSEKTLMMVIVWWYALAFVVCCWSNPSAVLNRRLTESEISESLAECMWSPAIFFLFLYPLLNQLTLGGFRKTKYCCFFGEFCESWDKSCLENACSNNVLIDYATVEGHGAAVTVYCLTCLSLLGWKLVRASIDRCFSTF